jgi:molybdenum cofactor cytidylyltransferase
MDSLDPHRRIFVSGIILAAGASTRMGTFKQLLPLGDRPVLQHVVDACAASRLDEILVILGHRADELGAAIRCPTRVRLMVNRDYEAGQSTSLQSGLRAASPAADAAAVVLGDQPTIGSEVIDQMLDAFAGSAACVVRPVYTPPAGRAVPGHPVILARRIWREMDRLRGDQGARALLIQYPEWVHEVPIGTEAPGDLDTWDDYQETSGRMLTVAIDEDQGRP